MEYLIGAALAVAIAGLAAVVGFARDRALTLAALMVVASYYVLFAAMGGSGQTIVVEIAVGVGFIIVGVVGYRTNLWLVAAGLVGHGIFDGFHHLVIDNPGVPVWWPGFCLGFDVVFGGWLGVLLARRSYPSLAPGAVLYGHDEQTLHKKRAAASGRR